MLVIFFINVITIIPIKMVVVTTAVVEIRALCRIVSQTLWKNTDASPPVESSSYSIVLF